MNKSDYEKRRRQALEMWLGAHTYQKIADTLGYYSRGAAHRDVQVALDELAEPGDDDERREIARLDAMLRGLWPKARAGDDKAVRQVMSIEARRRELKADNGVAKVALLDEINEWLATEQARESAADHSG
jgi:hypothetical protein